MITEQITRSKLINTWEARLQELRCDGEDSSHIARFLERVKGLRGHDVGDLCYHLQMRQHENRPVWGLLNMVCCFLAGLIGFHLAGVKAAFALVCLIGCLGFYHQQLSWSHDDAFARELLARADYAL